MNEKTTLLPTAPADYRFTIDGAPTYYDQPPDFGGPPIRVIIAPGLEYDSSRRYKYGAHSIGAALMIFISFLLIEFRDCNFGIGVDIDKLEALHIGLLLFTLTLYMMSLFGLADFLFRYKLLFGAGLLVVYSFVGLMVWTTYEAVVNPCVQTFQTIPVDLTFNPSKNVFSHHDGIGIVVVLLDILASILLISAALNFHRRH